MITLTSFRLQGAKLDQVLLILASMVVLIDWLNGLLWHTWGASYSLAAIFKAVLLAGITVRGWQLCQKQLLAPLGLMLFMLLGPLYVSWLTGQHFLWHDLQLIAKSGALLLALAYFTVQARQNPIAFLRWLDWFVLGSYLLLLGNFCLGLAGYGGTAYQPMEEVAQKFLGIKGFFISTNELSALLLVLSCWLLLRAWQVKRWCYPLISIASLLMAGLMLTKTGLFGTMLLVVFIPLLLTPRHYYRYLYQHYRRRLWLLTLVLLSIMLLVLFNFTSVLQWVGIYDKLLFSYQQRGLAGIILSSRDYYLLRNFTAVSERYPEWLQLFGVGQGGVRLLLKKYFIELDLFDLLLFYGLAGVLLYALSFWRILLLAGSRLASSSAAAPVLLLNVLLLLVSLLAGHVLTSGMLWLPWAVVNAAVVAQSVLAASQQPVTGLNNAAAVEENAYERSA
ncbi:hypothetical protein GCM10010919_15840 [Alishewanella longhuensis]|uniref:Uncharacterized protein n=1 Tax=Alishewanella longhuensis TaxID=1091037 RepID=A0ABQ3KXF3_9ALTE|nr:hypothetical protein [Alishewanella longhuensis]GHG67269.1 hypothetical protein GCM10010919_15840 [Alishewanella longhuensis]